MSGHRYEHKVTVTHVPECNDRCVGDSHYLLAPVPLRPDVDGEARPAAGPTAGIRRGTVLERLRRWFRTWPFDLTDLRS